MSTFLHNYCDQRLYVLCFCEYNIVNTAPEVVSCTKSAMQGICVAVVMFACCSVFIKLRHLIRPLGVYWRVSALFTTHQDILNRDTPAVTG